MSFAGKNLTQGGQMTAYRWRMFIQVNNWIGFWIFILFAVLTTAIFLWRIPQEALDNGSLWWFASINSSFIDLMPATGTPKIYDVHYWYAPTATMMVLKMTLPQIYADPYMQAMGDQCQTELQWAAGASGLFSMVVFIAVTWFIANIGRKESEDEYISGMQLTDKPAEVNKLLRKNGEFSDLRVGDLHMVRMAEVLNFLMHGTIGVGKTRFTFGELMMTTAELSERLPEIKDIRVAIDAALKDGMIVPLDSEKGVFTSRIHLLDELSIQALSQEHLKSTKVVSFTRPAQYAPAALEVVEKDALVLMNAPSGVAGIRDLTAQLAGIAGANGRDVQVLASSAERAISLAKSDDLRERIISRQHVLSGDFHLKPQSTLIIEGAERLGLKETLVLLGEARAQDAQLVFLDSAGRQANGNAMSVLESAGVARSRRTEPAPGLEAKVVSIPNKRDRYEALANRFAELSGGTDNVTAVVVGKREQAQLTGLVREALQNAGQLGRDGVEIEARQPVWLDSKTRRMSGSYRPGMVLEDRTDAKERKSYVIDRVHEDTRVLSLIDGDGVLTRMKIGDISADWRLFSRETLSVATGEKLLSVAGDREHSLKAKDRLEVTGISEKGITGLIMQRSR